MCAAHFELASKRASDTDDDDRALRIRKATAQGYPTCASVSEQGNSDLAEPQQVDCAWLAAALNRTDIQIVLDTRPFTKFTGGHIKRAVHINSSKWLLKRLHSGVVALEDLVSEDCRALFTSKCPQGKQGSVVLVDNALSWGSAASALSPLVAALQDRFSSVHFLVGGFDNFKYQYPEHIASTSLRTQGSLTISTEAASFKGPQFLLGSPKSPAATEILPGLYLGAAKDAQSLDSLLEMGITHILNVTTDIPNFHEHSGRFVYKRLEMQDSTNEDLLSVAEDAFAFINHRLTNGNKVLVHCLAGISRSPTIVIAYIMVNYGRDLMTSYDFVKQQRSVVAPNIGFMGQLMALEKQLQSLNKLSNPLSFA